MLFKVIVGGKSDNAQTKFLTKLQGCLLVETLVDTLYKLLVPRTRQASNRLV